MSLEKPSPDIIQAVESAVAWLEAAKLKGSKLVVVADPHSPKGKDARLVPDAAAPPLWARFCEIGTNLPIFCDRDGVAKHQLAEIGYERRNGYRWLGDWPQQLLQREYPEWRRKLPGATTPAMPPVSATMPVPPPAAVPALRETETQ